MALPLDDIDHRHLVELHRKVDLLVKMVARQQNQIAILLKRRGTAQDIRARNYLRSVIKKQRNELGQNRRYITQLENELRLHGLE